jgi:hypothetical protein
MRVGAPAVASIGVPTPLPPIGWGNVTLEIAPITLTFTPDNWNLPQQVTVSAPATATGTSAVEWLVHSVKSSDPAYAGLGSSGVTVFVGTPGPVGPPTPMPVPIGIIGVGHVGSVGAIVGSGTSTSHKGTTTHHVVHPSKKPEHPAHKPATSSHHTTHHVLPPRHHGKKS